MSRRRAVAYGFAPLLAGVGILVLLVYLTGPRTTLATIGRLRLWQGAALVAAALASTAFGAFASRAILERYGHRVSAWLLFRLALVAFAVGWLVPSGFVAGFPVAAYFLRRRGVPFGRSIASFVIERFLELAVYALVLPAVLFSGTHRLVAPWAAYLAPLAGLTVVALDLALGWRLARRSLAMLQALAPAILRPVLERGHEFCATIAEFFEAPPRRILVVAALSALSIGAAFARAQLTVGFLDIPFGLPEVALVLTTTLLVLGIPVAPGALGVYEGGMAGLFHLLGRPPVEGVAYAMTGHAVELVVVLFGLVFLGELGISLSRVREATATMTTPLTVPKPHQ